MIGWQEMNHFLRRISRTDLIQTDRDFILRTVKSDLSWGHLSALADFEGVKGFFYYNMKRLDLLNRVPDPIREKIENEGLRSRKHTIAHLDVARELSFKCERAGIPMLTLQGLSLVTTVYNDPAIRGVGDADLMVMPKHKNRVRELLKQSGYAVTDPIYPDLYSKGEVNLDLHTHILNLDRIKSRRYIIAEDITPMWDSAVTAKNGLLVLEPHDNIIALALHALKHRYSRLIWVADFHESINKMTSNQEGWNRLINRAGFWRQKRILLYMLLMVEGIFGAVIPGWVKRDLGIDDLSFIEKRLLQLKINGFSPGSLFQFLWLKNIDSSAKKIRYMRESLFPDDNIKTQILQRPVRGNKKLFYINRVCKEGANIGRDIIQTVPSFLRH